MGVIYKLTFPSGKSYIGQTIRPFNERWRQHKNSALVQPDGGCRLLNRAINHYGPNNITYEILFETEDEFLNNLEMEMIWLYNTLSPNGYNLKTGGNFNPEYSDESRLKMSESQKLLYVNDEEIKKRIQINGVNIKNKKQLPMYVTERKNMEEALRVSEQRRAVALHSSDFVGTWDWDIANDVVTSDERFAEIFLVDPEKAMRGAKI